jgi:hypothetical protein
VVLRTIDKVSARRQTFDLPVDKTIKFGKGLFIKARACRKASPLDKPEDAAFLQIWEHNPADDKPRWVFSGWMFSSNPSLSAMEHAVYDVWVIACKNDTPQKTETLSEEKPPAPGDASAPLPAPAPETKPEPEPAAPR